MTAFAGRFPLDRGVLDGGVRICADARLDRRGELLGELRAAGRAVGAGHSDEELILEAYRAWGERCVERLFGDWSFAITDGPCRIVFAARDLFGVKPLYYAIAGGALVFSNRLDAVRAQPGVSGRLNELAIMDFLVAGYNQDLSTTTYADIRRIPPGHALSIGAGETDPRVWRHRELPAPPLFRYRRDEEVVERFHQVFRAAVADRMTGPAGGDARVSVFMSGGLDSPGIAAVAADLMREGPRGRADDLAAFTLAFDELIADGERRYARLAARHIGIPIEILPADDDPPFDGWDGPGMLRPEPYFEPSNRRWRDLLAAAAAHGPVALYGEDPDTLLSPVPLRRELGRGDAAGTLRRIAAYRAANGRLPSLRTGIAARAREALGRVRPGATGEEDREAPADRVEYPTWLDPAFERAAGGRARYEIWNAEPEPGGSPHAEPHAMLSAPLWQSFFGALDPGSTGIELEVRHPYLDERVVDFMLSLPSVPWRQSKHLLRVAFEGRLPKALLVRRKAPLDGLFEARLARWTDRSRALASLDRSGVGDYVDIRRLGRRLHPSAPTAWVDLRPIALAFWLGRRAEADGATVSPTVATEDTCQTTQNDDPIHATA